MAASLSTGAGGNGFDASGIAVLEASIQPLNSDQARELAAALLAAAAGSCQLGGKWDCVK